MKTKVERINLLPEAYKQAEQTRWRLFIMGGFLILESIFFIVCVVMPLKTERDNITRQLEVISLELNNHQLTEMNQVTRQLEEAKLQKEQWTKKYDELNQRNFINRRLLENVLSRVPLDLTINKLSILPEHQEISYLEGTILIQVTSQEIMAIFNYATLLESIYDVGTIDYEISYEETQDRYAYQMTVSMVVQTLESEETIQEIDLQDNGGENW